MAHADRPKQENQYRGITKHGPGGGPKGRPWVAVITIDGRTRQLGYFATPEDAKNAYDWASVSAYGASHAE